MIRRIPVTILLFTFCSTSLLSQEVDTLSSRFSDEVVFSDTIEKKELEEGHSPRKAMIYSIVCPGLGQAYNKKYWKIPIVYAALGGAVYAIYFNNDQYKKSIEIYTADGGQTDLNKRYLQYWRRNLELSIIAIVAVDALAVVDAYVDANLFYWDVDPDLTLRLEPSIQPIYNTSGMLRNNYGFKCSLTF